MASEPTAGQPAARQPTAPRIKRTKTVTLVTERKSVQVITWTLRFRGRSTDLVRCVRSALLRYRGADVDLRVLQRTDVVNQVPTFSFVIEEPS